MHPILKMTFILNLVLLSGCNYSEKGKWTEEDKAKFKTEVNSAPELENFGEHKTKWIECYLNKSEQQFASFSEADNDEKAVEKIAIDCGNEVFSNGSVKGKWSQKDKGQFYDELSQSEELENLGEYKDDYLACSLRKMELKYPSFYQANQDSTGVENICKNCIKTVIPASMLNTQQ